MRSLIRRWVALAPLGALTVLTVFVAFHSSSAAGTYAPTASFTSSSSTPGATADLTTQFDIPAPDPNFQAVISFTPAAYKIVSCTAQTASPTCADQVVPDGTATGIIDATATLGTLNNACNTSISVHFNLMDATTNESVTTVYQDTDANGHGQQFDTGPSGQPNGVKSYLDYLLRLARTQPFPGGVPLQPIQRLYGQTTVAGSDVGINFLVFAPGTTINGQVMDPILGYPSFTLLNNTGDPQGVFAPNPITDFCTPLSSTTVTLGTSNGIALRTNPNSDSTQTFVIYTVSQPDADSDGIENALDPCPFNLDTWNPGFRSVAGVKQVV